MSEAPRADYDLPEVGSHWVKPSFPVPTVATVTHVDTFSRLIDLKYGGKSGRWPFDLFFSTWKPFERRDTK